jgi:hypothetical protein
MAAGAPDGFGSRWRTVRGLRLHALESAGGLGTAAVLLPGLVTAGRSMVPPFLCAGGDSRLAGPGARSPGVGPW